MLADGRRAVLPGARPAGSAADRTTWLVTALWDLVWAGGVTNDTLRRCAPVLGGRGRRTRTRPARGAGAAAGPVLPPALGPPRWPGRWSLLPAVADRTPPGARHALAETLLERHGVLTRGAVRAERHAGRFRRRVPGAAGHGGDRPVPAGLLRGGPGRGPVRPAGRRRPAARDRTPEAGRALVLAATDPANPYGAALPWPPARGGGPAQAGPEGRRPGGAGGGRAGALRGARRQDPAVLGGRRTSSPPSTPWRWRCATARWASSPSNGRTAPRSSTPHWPPPWSRPASTRPLADYACVRRGVADSSRALRS